MAKSLCLCLINLIIYPSLKEVPLASEISIIYLNNMPRDAVIQSLNMRFSTCKTYGTAAEGEIHFKIDRKRDKNNYHRIAITMVLHHIFMTSKDLVENCKENI